MDQKVTCPNIGGNEIKKRRIFAYLGLFAAVTALVVNFYICPFKLFYYAIFIIVSGMLLTFFEVKEETCIVNAFLGVKNMGHKFQRVYDKDSLWTQRKISIRIIITTLMLSSLITFIVYVFDKY